MTDLEAAARASLPRLACFVAVAEALSFSRGAERLRLAQPWVSTQVATLEREWGVALFDRSGGRVRLTAAGDALLPAVRTVVGEVTALAAAVESVRRGDRGELRIGAPFYSTSFPGRKRMVAGFVRAHPGVAVHVEYRWTPDLLAMLNAGELDLAFVTDPFDPAGLRTLAVDRMVFAVVVPAGHPLAVAGPLEPGQLRGHRFATFERGLNPELYDRRFAPLLRVGAELVEAPEAMPAALSAFAAERGLLIWAELPEPLPARYRGATVRPVAGETAHVALRLVIGAGSTHPPALAFWEQAELFRERAGPR